MSCVSDTLWDRGHSSLLVKVSKAESAVRAEGVKQLRVRSIGDIAVIEVMPEDFGRVLSGRDRITAGLRSLGYKRIVLDLAGYSTGSMDQQASQKQGL